MKFRGCDSIHSVKRKYPSSLQKWFANCKLIMYQQDFLKPWCWNEFIFRNNLWPRLITRWHLGRFSQNVMTIKFRHWFLNIQHQQRKIYRIASVLIIIRRVSMPRHVERRESRSMVCETNHFLKFERIEQKAWKHSAEKYHDRTKKFAHSAVGQTPCCSEFVCIIYLRSVI